MKSWKNLPLLGILFLLFHGGCQSQQDAAELSSLRQSGDVTFLCIGPEGRGVPLSNCPQGPRDRRDGTLTVGPSEYELYALVTQTISAEIAVVKVTGDSISDAAGVLDADPSNPGLTHLRVGKKPGAIVSSPGGKASFVGVEEVGKEGIFGLPTSCLGTSRSSDGGLETTHDLTTWPACSLPSPPGKMEILVDEAKDGVRERCDAPRVAWDDLPAREAARRTQCSVDLFEESVRPGARKLVVALPEEGRLVVLDAQALLDRPPASFRSCLEDDVLEASVPLQAEVPERIEQPLPEELTSPLCTDAMPHMTYGPLGGPFSPRPSGMDAADGVLLVADRGAPVIHVLPDDPCELSEGAPLLVTSLEQPDRVVTTTDVAVSPKTPEGRQYAYAVDERGGEHASIVVFDLTPGQGARTPLVRPGSAEMTLEPPDRIEFSAPVKDIVFSLVEQPEPDPETGVAVSGVYCDPDPRIGRNSLPALYRPSQDFATGARSSLLRGLFGFALLGTGDVALIDVDAFDAACRRPTSSNPFSEPDFRGCQGDPKNVPWYTVGRSRLGTPTVTDELSCNVVMPHRARASSLMTTSETTLQPTSVPALSGLGRLTRHGRGLPTSRTTPEGRKRPIMLGVDFPSPGGKASAPAQVFVGSNLRSRVDASDPLVIDPNEAERPSMVLPLRQPRAYPQSEQVTVSYEGDFGGLHETGELTSSMELSDPNAQFCDLGVMDAQLTQQYGARKFQLSSGAAARFAEHHTDYIQVTSKLLSEDDTYWSEGHEGATCGGGRGFAVCDSVFGEGRGRELLASRDFTVVSAFQDRLQIAPRQSSDQAAEERLELLDCCFPAPISYRVRAAHQWIVRGQKTGFSHSVRARKSVDPETGDFSFPCEFDCRPSADQHQGRVFEISNVRCDEIDPESETSCRVGPFQEEDVVCAYDSSHGPVAPGGTADECIFDSPTRHFAIYRGLEPSKRDMTFGFEVTGGFRNQKLSLTTGTGTSVLLPLTLSSVGAEPLLGVVDSQDRGLIMIDLRSLTVASAFY